jgi:uncharacterized protein YuzE
MKEIKFKPVDYDPLVDSLFVSVPDRKYEYSVMLGDDVILDFGKLPGREKLDIVGFEILNASEKFGIKKYLLKNIRKLRAEIKVSEEMVKLKIEICVVQRRRERLQSKILEASNVGIPSMVASISV